VVSWLCTGVLVLMVLASFQRSGRFIGDQALDLMRTLGAYLVAGVFTLCQLQKGEAQVNGVKS
jgi:hypothetical protein